MSSEPSTELVDVIDDAGAVCATVSRHEVRTRNLRHRSVFIAVVSTQGDLVVHRRAEWKDIWPGRWDLAFGGVLAAGEGFDDAAARELAEEAGIVAELADIGGGAYRDSDVDEVAAVYVARHDGPFHFDDGEVVEIDRVPMDTVVDWTRTQQCCADSVALVVPPLVAWWESEAR